MFIKELKNAFKSTFLNFSYRKILGLSKEVLYVNFGERAAKLWALKTCGQKKLKNDVVAFPR